MNNKIPSFVRVLVAALMLVSAFAPLPEAYAAAYNIALEAGHGSADPGAFSCDKKYKEADITYNTANAAASILRGRGYNVTVYRDDKSSFSSETFDAFVALHVDYCAAGATGYKVSRYGGAAGTGLKGSNDLSDKLAQSLWEAFGAATGLTQDHSAGRYTNDMLYYFALRSVSSSTPAAIIEMGWMSEPNLSFLMNNTDKTGAGVANAIDNFIKANKGQQSSPAQPSTNNQNSTLAQSTLSPWDVSWIPSDSTGRAKIVGEINSILNGTGMAGMGQAVLDNAIIYKVNPALALAQFRKEASFAASGTLGAINNNPGNIIYTGGYYGESGKNGRFGVYASMSDGIKAFYMLLDRQYKDLSSVQQIVNRYAPSGDGDNNPTQYAAQISGWGATYQAQMIKAINSGGEPPVIVTTVPPPTVKAPRAPSPSYPNQHSTLDPKLWMTFIWASVPEATQYYVEYWGGPYSTLNSGWITQWNYYVGEMWQGTYSWRVKARNSAGESAWSETWTFTVPEKVTAPPIVIITTEPPPAKASAPLLSAPSHNASFDQQTSIEFNWNSAANATSYYLEYWGGAYGTLNSGWINGTSYKVGQMWQGAYSWRVKSRNVQGESDWSETRAFTIKDPDTVTPPPVVTTPPPVVTTVAPKLSAPALANPANSGVYEQKTEITFSWNNVNGATQYYLEYWGGAYGTLNSGWVGATSYKIGQMWAGTYSWRVKSRNASSESDWSETWTFTIKDTPNVVVMTPPPVIITTVAPPQPAKLPAPSLANPSNGGSYPQSTEIVLSWNASSNATQYKVELWGGPYSTMTPCNWQSGTSCRIGQMWQGTMSWKVKARNASSESDWSETWTFTIRDNPTTPAPIVTTPPPVITTQAPTTPPPAKAASPGLANPSNSGSYEQRTEITFTWNSSANANQYYVEYWGGPYGTLNSGWIGGTSYRIGQMWPGSYQWHVKSRNSAGESGWSETWSFTIQDMPTTVAPKVVTTEPPKVVTTQPPQQSSLNAPSLSFPNNGGKYAQKTEITLQWNSASGATQYKVELWGGPYSTMTPCNWQNGTSCRIGQMWPGTMSWKVKARDASGRESDWSGTWTFTIQ